MLLLLSSNFSIINVSYSAYIKAPLAPAGPTVKDDNLVVEKITDGLEYPPVWLFWDQMIF
jgi:hypothetical protein